MNGTEPVNVPDAPRKLVGGCYSTSNSASTAPDTRPLYRSHRVITVSTATLNASTMVEIGPPASRPLLRDAVKALGLQVRGKLGRKAARSLARQR